MSAGVNVFAQHLPDVHNLYVFPPMELVGRFGTSSDKPGVHIIATIAIAQKALSDQNDYMETVRSAIVVSQ